jgi:hypothetical protein
MKFLKSFSKFINENTPNSGPASFIDELCGILNCLTVDEFRQAAGTDFVAGFVKIQYVSPLQGGTIATVINHYEGQSSASKRHDFDQVAHEKIGAMGSTFTQPQFDVPDNLRLAVDFNIDTTSLGDFDTLSFSIMKDGQQSATSEAFSPKSQVADQVCCVLRLNMVFNEEGRYTITNSLDKQYYLEVEVKAQADLGVKESRRNWLR